MGRKGWFRNKIILVVIALLVISSLPIALAMSNDNSFLSWLKSLFLGHKITGAAIVTSPPAGTVGLWYFDENTGTTATDSSGNGNTGTLVNGPTWTAGISGSGLNLDGVDDYILVPDSDSLSIGNNGVDSPFSIEMWVKRNRAIGSSTERLISKYHNTNGVEYNMQFHPTGFYFQIFDGTPSFNSIGRFGPEFGPGAWHHVVATYDGSKSSSGIKIYVDGVRIDTTDANTGTYTGSNNGPTPVTIGATHTPLSNFFSGQIDEVAIYKRELTATEILQHYQAGLGTSVLPACNPAADLNDDASVNILDAIIAQNVGVGRASTNTNRAVRCEGQKVTLT